MAQWLLGMLWPGGGQWARGQWLAGLLVLWVVPYLVVTAMADMAATQPHLGLVAGASAALAARSVGPQPLWTLILALAVHGGAAWAARNRP